MSDILDLFTQRLPAGGRILDVGAGAGRDSKSFLAQNYKVVALEPSSKMAKVLRNIPGLDVVECGAEQVEDVAQYDGVWACASLLHLDEKTLNAAMQRLAHALKPGGVLYMCFKDGKGVRKVSDGRLFHDLSAEGAAQLAKAHGLKVEVSWRTPSK
jgi:SAM-dependent methyltransferase